ncbi:hypothetical protein AVEN_229605-1 [Araneus ventricosus]|uniref:Uncharacterized protein n=1 Tax=Araneus ventricosus TaxID=182803 RepID=A0A4Y2DA23_ARAVE|nr:hypothetical protein AVEN_229605-1 [Araneus ventricosus]
MKDGGRQATTDGICRCQKLSYEIKIVPISRVVVAGEQSKCIGRKYRSEVLFRFHSKMEGDGEQAIFDDIFRRHMFSYEIKVVEIRRVVVSGELSECYSP